MTIGRPTKMTPETMQKLEQGFLLGCTDLEACLYAGISPRTLYNYQEDNPDFVQRKEMLKSNPVMKARKVILDSLERGDVATANKVIDRKEGSKLNLKGDLKHEHEHSELSDTERGARIVAILNVARERRAKEIGDEGD